MDKVRLDRVQPCDLMAERAVIGAMLVPEENKRSIPDAIGVLGESGDVFYRAAHGMVYDAIIDLFDRSEVVDLVTVTNRLKQRDELEKVGGVAELDGIWDSVPAASNVVYYAQQVMDHFRRRRLITCAAQAFNKGFDDTLAADDVIEFVQQELIDLDSSYNRQNVVVLKNALKPALEHIVEMSKRGDDIMGLRSGFRDLDRILSGFQQSDLIIIAGRPSMGKSMLVQNIAHNVAKVGGRVLIFTLETSMQSLVLRMLARESGISFNKIRAARLRDNEWPLFTSASGTLSEMDILIDDTPGITETEMLAKARRLHIEKPLDLVIVDYMQLMHSARRQENRQQEVATISESLKRLARDLQIPVIGVSQLNRSVEQRTGNRPQLSDLRESGSIEQDADVVIMMYRESYYDDEAQDDRTELIIAKQRNGPTGTVHLYTDAETMKFANLSLNTDVPPDI